MAFVNRKDRKRVAAAVQAAEQRSRGEFVTVIAQASDSYLFIPLTWAAFLALLVPWPVAMLWPMLSGALVLAGQGALFVLLAIVLVLTPLRHRVVPRAILRHRAKRLAQQLFLELGVANTAERNGVLLFVSAAERHVEIIADAGIHAKVDKDRWQGIVDRFVADLKADSAATALVNAVNACGDTLAEHFPGRAEDRNELPDRLIVL